MSIFKKFINQYSLQKTLRFGLEPVGATREIIRKLKEESDFNNPLSPLIYEDWEKSEVYRQVKKAIDDLHRHFLSFALDKENLSEEIKNLLKDEINKFYGKYSENVTLKKELKNLKKKKQSENQEAIISKIDKNNKEIIEIQKQLAKHLKSVLDTNAPKFLEENFTEQREYLENLLDEKQEEKNELESYKGDLQQKIKKTLKESKEQKEEFIKQKEELEQKINNLKKEIKELKKCEGYKFSESKNLYDKTDNLFTLLRLYFINNQEVTDSIKKFDAFHTYFSGFNTTRQNVYDIENKNAKNKDSIFKSTSIAFRLFEQNIKFHFDNILKWQKLKEYLNKEEIKKQLEEKSWNFQERIGKVERQLNFSAEVFLSPESFFRFFSQTGVDDYNLIIGGQKAEEQNPKIQGLNEIINLTRQQIDGDRKNFPSLKEFYKQILSKKGAFIETIQDNKHLIEELKKFVEKEEDFIRDIDKTQKENGDLSFTELLEYGKEQNKDDGSHLNLDDVYVSKEVLRFFSQDLVSSWKGLETWYLASFDDKEVKKQHRRKVYTFGELQKKLNEKREWINLGEEEKKESANFYTQFIKPIKDNFGQVDQQEGIKKKRAFLKDLPEEDFLFTYLANKFTYLLKQQKEHLRNLENSKILENAKCLTNPFEQEEKNSIKKYLDASQDLYRFLRSFNVKEKDFTHSDKGANQEQIWNDTVIRFTNSDRNNITKFYNKVRNFLTKKEFNEDKYKLNFENPTLANGWDKNKETDNTCVILLKDGKYYLGIMSRDNKNLFDFTKLEKDLEDKKKKIKKKEKNLSEKKEGTKTYKELKSEISILQEEIQGLEIDLSLLSDHSSMYKKMDYKQVANPALDIHNLVYVNGKAERFTKGLDVIRKKHCPEIQKIREKGTYKGTDIVKEDLIKLIDYYKKCALSYWKWADLKFEKTEEYNNLKEFTDDINKQGYKIEFSNISQSYVDRMVENQKFYLFEIYSKDFSKRSQGRPNLHTIYWKALFEEQNLKDVVIKLNGQAELFYRKASLNYSKEKREKGHHYQELKSKFSYPIIKDKRYSEDKILFHCSITINFKSEGRDYISSDINDFLKEHYQDINIIGIDRGEKNLLYYSVIDKDGKILEQGSFNEIDSGFQPAGSQETQKIDYHQKLDEKQKARGKARENWEKVENIKDLKNGYLSQVVHQLAQLILKHNAIVVLENLNAGFKGGRFKFEKQVYQKFEMALIHKLNYLVNKKETDFEKTGHYLKGYQLTNKFKTFSDIGIQSGILFYTDASYTSKTDPVTGYMRGLYPKYSEAKKAQEFFSKFNSIKYNGKFFEFTYNLKNLKGMTGSYEDKKDLDEEKINKIWTICSHVERSQYKEVKLTEEQRKQDEYKEAVNGKWRKNVKVDVNQKLVDLFNKELKDGLENKDYKDFICSQDLTEQFEESKFLAKLIAYLKRLLDMRVFIGDQNNKDDFILSPVEPFFDSRQLKNYKPSEAPLPVDSDANGAYNIARKGVMILERIRDFVKEKEEDKLNLSITKTDWQNFSQKEEIVEKQKAKYEIINKDSEED